MKHTLTLLFALAALVSTAQTDILDARTNYTIGDVVTVTGVVTSGESLGSVRYIQDETAGIAIYPGTDWGGFFEPEVGDEITVIGEISEFMGLLEVGPNLTSVVVESSGNALPDWQTITPADLDESVEAERIAMFDCVFQNAGGVFQGNTSYTFTSGGQTAEIYVRSSNALVGEDVPFGAQNLYGIGSQFSDSGLDGYQMLVEDLAGIESASPINITSSIGQENVTTSSFDVTWTTDVSGDTFVQYGTDPSDLNDEVYMGTPVTSHSVTLEGLEAATVYYVMITSANDDGQAESNVVPFITRSTSPGTIIPYFTKGVDTSVATIEEAVSLGNLVNDTIAAYIGRVEHTLDIAVYNINDQTVINAINAAFESGVQVRYIAHSEPANIGLGQLNPGIPVIERPDDSGSGMHNKFFIMDADYPEKAVVMNGSLNMTTEGMIDDYNNIVFYHEQSMARGFELEFEEMWGATGDQPDASNALFGENKTINTPWKYYCGDVLVEVYFSPTDNTTYFIQQAIASTDVEFDFATLAFTRDDLRDAVIAVQEDFFSFARGVIEQSSGTGTEYQALFEAGVGVVDHQPLEGQLHHKYCIVDANNPESDPMVVTGSHNWSNSAENVNDENTVFIHDARVANLFFQEFQNIMNEAVSVEELTEAPALLVYPNPANDVVWVDGVEGIGQVTLVDMQGRTVMATQTSNNGRVQLNVSSLTEGVYVIRLSDDSGERISTVIKR